jgi:threonine/homoserine/homoserine lactone efflux protein
VAIFFIAFLPQFVDPTAALPLWMQFLILGVIVNCAFASVDLLTVLFASAVAARLGRGGRVRRWIELAGGSILIALGVRLAADRS